MSGPMPNPSTKPLCGPDILTLRRTARTARAAAAIQGKGERSGESRRRRSSCGRVRGVPEHTATRVSASRRPPVMEAASLSAPDLPHHQSCTGGGRQSKPAQGPPQGATLAARSAYACEAVLTCHR